MDFDFLREAFYELRRDGAPGLSGITVKDYEKDLEANLKDLHERLRTQAYVAPPIKRVGRSTRKTERTSGSRPKSSRGCADIASWCALPTTVCHEGTPEDGVLRAAMLHK